MELSVELYNASIQTMSVVHPNVHDDFNITSGRWHFYSISEYWIATRLEVKEHSEKSLSIVFTSIPEITPQSLARFDQRQAYRLHQSQILLRGRDRIFERREQDAGAYSNGLVS